MSFSKRIFDLARSNLNALLDKAGADTIEDLSDEELEAELERRRERRRREEDEQRQREEAESAARARARERTRTAPPRGATAPGGRARPDEGKRRAPPVSSAGPSEKRLRELYATLEVPYGAGLDEVKRSFRRLMRKYHPDLHVHDPVKHKAATELTMSLTQGFSELEAHLQRNRR
jgi:hypothetical protein